MILVSACLIGMDCRYNCEVKVNKDVIEFLKDKSFVPVCPEQQGGLATPRQPSEIQGGTGIDVIEEKASIINKAGDDVTEEFVRGAYEILKLTEMYDVEYALLKAKSPSCGSGKIYDGTFNGKLIDGDGICTALLKKHNIKVINEDEL